MPDKRLLVQHTLGYRVEPSGIRVWLLAWIVENVLIFVFDRAPVAVIPLLEPPGK